MTDTFYYTPLEIESTVPGVEIYSWASSHGPVGLIKYVNPNCKVNCFTTESLVAMTAVLNYFANQHPNMPIVILGDEEKGYCQGGDISNGASYLDENGWPIEALMDFHQSLKNHSSSIIHLVTGKVKAGGLVQLLAGGFVVAHENVYFQSIEFPTENKTRSDEYVATQPRAILHPEVVSFWQEPQPITAQEAQRIGLVDVVLTKQDCDGVTDVTMLDAVVQQWQQWTDQNL